MHQADHVPHRELGDRLPIDTGRPEERHPMTLHRLTIDHVQPNAILAHDAQLGEGSEHVLGEPLQGRNRLLVAAKKLDESTTLE